MVAALELVVSVCNAVRRSNWRLTYEDMVLYGSVQAKLAVPFDALPNERRCGKVGFWGLYLAGWFSLFCNVL